MKMDRGRTLLIHASHFGFKEIVEDLMQDPNLLVNIRDDDQNTALHLAASCDRVEIVKMFARR